MTKTKIKETNSVPEPTILYEDTDILAVNKPAGLVVHSDGKTDEPNLADWFVKKYPKSKDVGEPGKSQKGEEILRPGIVHRLDRETSGAMLLAKTAKGFETLKKQFQEHTIQKEYHAFAYGEIKNDKGVIDRPIGRSASDFRKWSAQRGSKGERREAVTEYEVVMRGEVKSAGKNNTGQTEKYSLVYAFPKTGRTHQIRVHFKAINYPLVADSLYAPETIRETSDNIGFARLALHSFSISFTDTKGKAQTVTALEPEDFLHARAKLR